MGKHVHCELIKAWADGAKIEFLYGEESAPGDLSTTEIWIGITEPRWRPESRYRIAITKPSVDWSNVHPRFNWLYRQPNNLGWLSEEKPTLTDAYFSCNLFSLSAQVLASYSPGTCAWQESVVQRPTQEESK